MEKRHQHKHIVQRPQRKEPETEKEIRERIKELEYARISLNHYPSTRKAGYEIWLTDEIKRLETKLKSLLESKSLGGN